MALVLGESHNDVSEKAERNPLILDIPLRAGLECSNFGVALTRQTYGYVVANAP